MNGNSRRALVVQERDRHLIRELAALRVVDREFAKAVSAFGSTTRVNVRLLALVRAGLLRRFFLGTAEGHRQALYALSAKGAALVGVPLRGPQRRSDSVLVADYFVQHQLAINEIHVGLKYGVLPHGVTFGRWIGFFEPLTDSLRLIPDGYVELRTASETLAAFVEVDLGHESLKVWKEKVQNYLRFALSGEAERRFGQPRFRVLVLTDSERRLRSIRQTVTQSTNKIFWFSTLAATRGEGFFRPVWLRPQGDHQQPLLRERS
jgi:hypothetical protein